ncbi:uncharacterized protein NEPG_00634 [Nematocida parisii ERTm1]|uniref:Uncharacterized protein n=1 Tax=Nematocida parisii (strain ERTm3) TaxID=935791 RepID=I3ED95_NEMP3|nr:uncharacterized protein NEPG_00634 [Nematocida parisii ERTm1]EIJ87192.1 hypothetical protein NEQG_02527 [Nematocida parisii ERTm3]EIJ95109.1 hypothetical protein NEPG_00634 [Nematocida parisii ERTm1]|eukprot:XP_013058465.1 hypothetical protein NEPG_00634 [Nematocida parisii ERTm1]
MRNNAIASLLRSQHREDSERREWRELFTVFRKRSKSARTRSPKGTAVLGLVL